MATPTKETTMETTRYAPKNGRTKFADFNWSDLGGSLTPRTSPRTWMKLHDLAVDVHEAATAAGCELGFDELRALTDAAASGLPITLTLKHLLGNGRRDTVETTRATFIVESIDSLSPNTTANFRVRTWGFAYPVSFSRLAGVEVPKADYSYTEAV